MSFVNIFSLSEDKDNRHWQQLCRFYENKNLLKRQIRHITHGVFDRPEFITDKTILFKPNWVLQDRREEDLFCLRTNNSFLLAAIEVILEKKPRMIIVGDAPIQSCKWSEIVDEVFFDSISNLEKKYSVPIKIIDFRRVIFDQDKNQLIESKTSLRDFVIFDLGKKSHLEPISSNQPNFRVTKYDPKRLAESHSLGRHKYCLAREVFSCDLIISLPKIKTHQKTGITGALKNLVGVNGDKDYLPHHRVGGTGFGGDCYPGKSILRRLSELLLDQANRNLGKSIYWPFFYGSKLLWKLSFPKNVHHLDAGWYGNDTCWRMVLDLNTIVQFGKSDGSVSTEKQRKIFSLCDGIVGGQGNGPLWPEPLALGVISFSDDSLLNDVCMSKLMGFDYHKISLLKHSFSKKALEECNIFLNNRKIKFPELELYSIKTNPPPGWANIL